MGNAGIDYGRGMVNIDHETGIRYGVIHQGEVLQAWADSSEAVYSPYCPKCGNEIAPTMENIIEAIEEKEFQGKRYKCPKCKQPLTGHNFDNNEPSIFIIEEDGYQCQQSADDPDVFVLKSPFYTYCKLCSPCAPGAGYLMDYATIGDDIKSKVLLSAINGNQPNGYASWIDYYLQTSRYILAYCFGHDWFEDNRAPYPVFSVKTGELVNPE